MADLRDISVDPKAAVPTIFGAIRASLHRLVRVRAISAFLTGSLRGTVEFSVTVALVHASESEIIECHVRSARGAHNCAIPVSLPASETVTGTSLTLEARVIEPAAQGTGSIQETLGAAIDQIELILTLCAKAPAILTWDASLAERWTWHTTLIRTICIYLVNNKRPFALIASLVASTCSASR